MLNETMLPHILLVLWLLPCAVCDLRERRVPNWLTLPALPPAIWWGTHHGLLPLTLLILLATFFAFLQGGMGGADGKMATVMAAVSPLALLLAFLLMLLTLAGLSREQRRHMHLPAAAWMEAGALISSGLTLLPLFSQGGFS